MANYPSTLATTGELATWMSTSTPSTAGATLRSCTTLVFDAVKGVAYDVDEDTMLATDAEVGAALKEATLIQAAAWITLGIDPFSGGIDTGGVKKSKKIGSGSFEMAGADNAAAAKAYAAGHLVPEAEGRLRRANLLSYFPGSR